MMKKILLYLIVVFSCVSIFGQGYSIGEKASDFKLKNVDDKNVSLDDYKDAKGFIVVFTCNHCPFAKAYENRIIELDKKYKTAGFPVIAINPNDPNLEPEDSFDEMKKRALDKNYSFPYLFDEKQEVYRKFGASRTPHVFILQKINKDLIVKYIGTIDDNYEDPTKVTSNYVSDAIEALLANREPNPSTTKAIGCSIKDKRNK